MGASEWTGLVLAAGSVLAAMGVGLKLIFNQFNGIVDGLRAQLNAALVQIQAKQDAIDELFAMNADCEAEAGEIYGWVVAAHAFMERHKHEGEDVPCIPPRRPRMIDRAAYLQRRAAQNTQNSITSVTTVLNGNNKSTNGTSQP